MAIMTTTASSKSPCGIVSVTSLPATPIHRSPEELLKPGLIQVFLALDYLHTKRKLVHTDIKADNIFIEIEDEEILDDFLKAEMEEASSSRKFVDDTTTAYASRRFGWPRVFVLAVLGDFGSAVPGDEGSYHNTQPRSCRSPEVLLKAGWSYPVDIWNVESACFMVMILMEKGIPIVLISLR